jgi:glycosyltransferase involved in cell wall biosynthesis
MTRQSPLQATSISAIIISFNEENNIAEAIASLPFCDEVIVVDSGSTDRTCEIATASGARVIVHDWSGYTNQKNFAAGQVSNDWIFSLDADERVSMELADELVRWKKNPTDVSAMAMPRRAFYLGKWINHSGWYPDRKIRLYNRRHSRWIGDFVHERLQVDGRVGRFQGDLLHFPYREWQDHIERINRYTQLAADAARAGGRGANLLKLVLGPPLVFLKSSIVHAGFLDGWRGFAIAYMAARYVLQREFRILRR